MLNRELGKNVVKLIPELPDLAPTQFPLQLQRQEQSNFLAKCLKLKNHTLFPSLKKLQPPNQAKTTKWSLTQNFRAMINSSKE